MLSLDRQNQYREQFRRIHPTWQPATEVYESLIRSRLRPEMRVLDIGCGRGGVLEQLNGAVEYPFGVDPDGSSLVEHRLVSLPRAQSLAEALPLPGSSYDGVVCSWVLEHLKKPENVFSEVARVLRPGGFFVFLTPNARALVTVINRLLRPAQHMLVRRLYGRDESDTFPVQYRANTKARVEYLVKQSGLQPEEWRLVRDPSYLAFSRLGYWLSIQASQITPPVHLVGVFRKQ